MQTATTKKQSPPLQLINSSCKEFACGHFRRRFGVVVLSAAGRFRCSGLRPPLGALRTVKEPSVEVTCPAWDGSVEHASRAFALWGSVIRRHSSAVTRCLAYSGFRANSPRPARARSASTNWQLTSFFSVAIRSGILLGCHWTADFNTWLMLSHPLLVQLAHPALTLSLRKWTILFHNAQVHHAIIYYVRCQQRNML